MTAADPTSTNERNRHIRQTNRMTWGWALLAGLPLGMAVARLLYESAPMTFPGLGDSMRSLIAGMAGVLLWRVLLDALARVDETEGARMYPAVSAAGLLAALYIFTPPGTVNTLRGAVLIGAMLLATALILSEQAVIRERLSSPGWWPPALAGGIAFVAYLVTMPHVVGRADTFEFQVVGPSLGIAHPTGYPLYTLLSKLFSLLPLGSMATRINLMSVVFATAAVALLALLMGHILKVRPAVAVVAALVFGLSPTFWGQAVIAEVYALHNALGIGLIVLSLWLLNRTEKLTWPVWRGGIDGKDVSRVVPAIFALAGLGLAHHLTTVLLLPAVILAVLMAWPRLPVKTWLISIGLMLAGLALYLYLPVRWPMLHNGTPMPLGDFIGWITGARFGGALQLRAWLDDPARYGIVGRLLLDGIGVPGAVLAGFGLVILFTREWRAALITLGAFAGVIFYGLNYLVPDLLVFILPAFWLMATWIAVGASWLLDEIPVRFGQRYAAVLGGIGLALLTLIPATFAWETPPTLDWSDEAALEDWGREVLALPLDEGSAILADSEKIAPLEYLHSVEELRPDMEMIVLGLETDYYDALYARLGAGQTVYLARLLPGLEGSYYLRSVGPLIEVGTKPSSTMPGGFTATDTRWGNDIALTGFHIDADPPAVGEPLGLTLAWQAPAVPINGGYHIQISLLDASGTVAWRSDPAFPVSGRYPTSAWKPGEVITDYHTLPLPHTLEAGMYQLAVRLVPPFSDEALVLVDGAEQAVLGAVEIAPARNTPPALPGRAIRTANAALAGFSASERALAGGQVQLAVDWRGAEGVQRVGGTSLVEDASVAMPFDGAEITLTLDEDRLLWALEGDTLRCGWSLPVTDSCKLGETAIEGETAAGAIANFDNQMVLMRADFEPGTLRPGDWFEITLEWQGLRSMGADYTVFVQLIGPDGRPHGQIDQWPAQGTYPTSTWPPGERVTDRYRIPVDADAPPGLYEVYVGVYLLGTNERLPVIGMDGRPVDDKVSFEGLAVD